MAVRYYYTGSNDFNTLSPQGAPLARRPFGEASRGYIIYEQRYWIHRLSYVRASVNALAPASVAGGATAYFVDDSPLVPVVSDIAEFTRSWATKPSQIIEYEQLAVQYPARSAIYFFDIGVAGGEFDHYPYIATKAYTLPRLATIFRDFFLIGSTGVGGEDYSAVTGIPALNETLSSAPDITARGAGPFNNAQWDDIKAIAQNVGLFSGAILAPSDLSLLNPTSGHVTRTANALSAGNYYVGQSLITRLMGNIWERRAVRITL